MRRISYFDGLRGLACMQVVLFHYSGAFWPKVSLGYFANGGSAVAIFFLMSGFVLTDSFQKTPDMIALNTASRAIRLALPAAAAVILAILLTRAAGQEIMARSVATVEIFFSQLSLGLNTSTAHVLSLNPPLWTLAIEFWGSMLVLILVWTRHRSRLVYGAAIFVSVCMIGVNELSLFTIGSLCAGIFRRPIFSSKSIITWIIGPVLIFAGVMVCSAKPPELPGLAYGLLRLPNFIRPQIEFGSILIFMAAGIMLPLQQLLNMRFPAFLGRISFSVYLLHFPIMATLGNFIFLAVLPHGRVLAACLAFMAGMAVTLGAAILFNRYCDQPAIHAAKSLKNLRKRISQTAASIPQSLM